MCNVKEMFAGLNDNASRLLLYIILHADENGSAEVSERSLAVDLGMGRQQVRAAKQSLLATQRITQSATHQATHLKLCCCGSCGKSKTTKQPTQQPTQQPTKSQKVEVAPEWVAVEFAGPFLDWLEYKKARRESYKTDKSLKACYSKLVKLSNGDAAVAAEIVEQSMANNWQGLFPLKQDYNNGKENWRTNNRDDELAAQAVRMRSYYQAKRTEA